ncbi:sugar transporter [Cantharellus anzutake]|uniref:sugar transporter n=1 Tax=Cantharellus anzutake TaxID=1750568 RepID=UPI00190778EC|nr:sugar transporter [Cantharellus anzutake]KAF8324695.1 sugar transporter [Cantharellus anzutake]
MGGNLLFQNLHVYQLAAAAYLGIILFGYDTGVAGGIVSQKAFSDNFGLTGASQAHKDAVSSNVVAVLQGGAFFGALFSIPATARFGRKLTLLVSDAIFCVGAILTTVAGPGQTGLNEIYVGRVISGVGIGAISAVAPAYVSECSPKEVRGRITGLFQIFVATGVMLSYWTNYGVQQHQRPGPRIWRIPFGVQLIPAGLMAIGLLFATESPRWLITWGRETEALNNLAHLRRLPADHPSVVAELAEIEAAVREEREARAGLGWKGAFFAPGNRIRFIIALVIFMLQQFSGQNSVGYYAPLIFQSIGYSKTGASLLASGVYGIVKVVATAVFVFFLVDVGGRKWPLFVSSIGMGTVFYIIGAILKTHPPDPSANSPAGASKAMAGLLYIYVAFYSFGWGPIPWIYVADIFPTRTRHYGLALASCSQWLFNFVITKITPTIKTHLGYKMFITFATINIGGMAVFSLLIPETKGRSLEEMDIIFGTVNADDRQIAITKAQTELRGGGVGRNRQPNPTSDSKFIYDEPIQGIERAPRG